MVLRLVLFEVLIYCIAHGRIELFGAEAVSAANHLDAGNALLEECGANVEVEGFAEGTGFLRPVEHRDFFTALGDRRDELVRNERAVQAYFDEADLVPLFVHLVDGLFHRVRAAAHDDDHVFRVGRAAIVEQMIISAREFIYLFHHLFDDGRGRVIIFIRRFAVLEVGIAVLRRALLDGVLWIERAALEIVDVLHIDERFHLVIVDHVDLGNFMRSAETVKEVQERHFGFQSGKVRHEREIHNFLYRTGSEHRKASLAACHNVLMVTENVQRMRRDRARGNVKDGGQQFARDLVHVGDHEQKALAGGVGGSQSAGGKGTVHSARCAAFRLHFGEPQFLAEHVHPARGRPFVRDLCHGGRRRDGIDRRDLREGIGDVAGGCIAVNRHLLHKKNNLR